MTVFVANGRQQWVFVFTPFCTAPPKKKNKIKKKIKKKKKNFFFTKKKTPKKKRKPSHFAPDLQCFGFSYGDLLSSLFFLNLKTTPEFEQHASRRNTRLYPPPPLFFVFFKTSSLPWHRNKTRKNFGTLEDEINSCVNADWLPEKEIETRSNMDGCDPVEIASDDCKKANDLTQTQINKLLSLGTFCKEVKDEILPKTENSEAPTSSPPPQPFPSSPETLHPTTSSQANEYKPTSMYQHQV